MKTEQEINAEKAAKPRLDLVPPRAINAAGRALGYGAAKHGTPAPGGWGTWRIAGTEQAKPATHYACLLRHLTAWRDGEERDPESGLSHLDHAAAQLCILIDTAEVDRFGAATTVTDAERLMEIDANARRRQARIEP